MPTQAEIGQFQESLTDLSAVAVASLVQVWRGLDPANPVGMVGTMRDALVALIEGYGPMSGELGAIWFENLREQAGVTSAFQTRPVVSAVSEAVQNRISWSAIPLFDEKPDAQSALSRFTATLQREVALPARVTVEENVRRDPAKPRWARHASANACAFCALLATRGAAYRSEESAGLARKYHPHCHCVPVAVWPSQTYEPAPYVADWANAYSKARKSAGGDVKAVLTDMRQILGAS